MGDDDAARLGTRLGNYTLTEIIGRGGMGVVYRGEHVYIHKRVAVKVLHRHLFGDAEARRRFLREAQAASAVKHPNIVGVTDFGEEPDGTVFLVMDHLEGRPLDRVLREEKTIELFRAIVIASQVARAVGEAHRRGIVHRDLKPENIMLERRPERRQIVRLVTDERGTLEVVETTDAFDFVTVLDFGAAKVWAPDAVTPASPGVVIATPAYMAPETARAGLSDTRSDIYALGVIFYQMLTGTTPFQGDSAADIMMKHVLDPVESPRRRNPRVEISAEADRLVQRALAKNPDDRHRSMDELFHDLQRCYGTIRFRRQDEAAADPVPAAGATPGLARRPIPLVRSKKASPAPNGVATPGTPLPPAPSTPVPANRATPIPLTKRKERHRTLPFGPQPPPPDPRGEAVVEVDEEATTGQHRTQPYAESAVVAAAQAHAHGTPLPREGE